MRFNILTLSQKYSSRVNESQGLIDDKVGVRINALNFIHFLRRSPPQSHVYSGEDEKQYRYTNEYGEGGVGDRRNIKSRGSADNVEEKSEEHGR